LGILAGFAGSGSGIVEHGALHGAELTVTRTGVLEIMMRNAFGRVFNVVAVSVLLMHGGNAAAAVVASTFDSDAEGWIVSGDATSGLPTFVGTGGNPGGHIEADDRVSGGVWYFQAPSKFLGDLSGAYGELLRFDLKQTGSGSQFSSDDVILNGGGLELTLDTLANPLPVGEWVSYSVRLDTSEAWMNGGATATAADVLFVLSSLDRLRIRGEYISGSDTGRLDNVSVSVVPIPAAVYFLGSGVLGLLATRRRG